MTCNRCYCDDKNVFPINDTYGEHIADLCTDCIETVGSIVVDIRDEDDVDGYEDDRVYAGKVFFPARGGVA